MRLAQLPRLAACSLAAALLAAPAIGMAQSSSPPATESAPPTASSAPPPAAEPVAASASPSPSPAPDEEREHEHEHPAPPPPGYGRLRIAVNRPDTEVFVDGRSVGTAPLEHDELRGPHLLRLASPGFKDWQGSVDIDEGTLTPVRVMLRATPDRSAGVMTLTIATLVFGAGLATGVLSNGDHAALEQDRLAGVLDNHDPRIDRGAILAGTADACFLLSAVLAVAGVYLVAHDTTSPSIGRVGRAWRLGGRSE